MSSAATLERAAIRSGNDWVVMTEDERAAYEAWRDQATHRAGSAQQRAFIAGMRAERAAAASWERMTPGERADHREACPDLCPACEEHRPFGECITCGKESEAVGVDELSVCCGSKVHLSPFDPLSIR